MSEDDSESDENFEESPNNELVYDSDVEMAEEANSMSEGLKDDEVEDKSTSSSLSPAPPTLSPEQELAPTSPPMEEEKEEGHQNTHDEEDEEESQDENEEESQEENEEDDQEEQGNGQSGSEEVDYNNQDSSESLSLADIDPSILPSNLLTSSPRKDSVSQPTALANKNRAPIGNVNLQRSYEICKAVVEKSANRARVEAQLVPPPAKQKKLVSSTSVTLPPSSSLPVPLPPGATLVVTPSPTPGGPKTLTFGPPRLAMPGGPPLALRAIQPSAPSSSVRLRLPPSAVPISPQQLHLVPRPAPQLIPVSRLAGLRPEASTCLTVAAPRQAPPIVTSTTTHEQVSCPAAAPCVLTLCGGASSSHHPTPTNSRTLSTSNLPNSAHTEHHSSQHLLFPFAATAATSTSLVLPYQALLIPQQPPISPLSPAPQVAP